MNRLDLINTDEARVARIVLAPSEISPQHLHSNLIENIVCLNGSIEVHEDVEGEIVTRLKPGQIHEIAQTVVHYLINAEETDSEYLLIQKGVYDFVPVSS